MGASALIKYLKEGQVLLKKFNINLNISIFYPFFKCFNINLK